MCQNTGGHLCIHSSFILLPLQLVPEPVTVLVPRRASVARLLGEREGPILVEHDDTEPSQRFLDGVRHLVSLPIVHRIGMVAEDHIGLRLIDVLRQGPYDRIQPLEVQRLFVRMPKNYNSKMGYLMVYLPCLFYPMLIGPKII